MIGDRPRTRTTAEWIELLDRVGVPCGPVLRMDQVFADPQVEYLQLTTTVESPELGAMTILRNPVTMSEGDKTVRSASPAAGQHTDQVLAELGLTTEEIEELRERKVI